MFVLIQNAILLVRNILALNIGLSSFLINMYVTTIFYGGNELSILILILVAFRVRSLKNELVKFLELRNSQWNLELKTKLNRSLILLNQIYDIINLTSKCFGLQMLVLFLVACIIGMFTIFAAFQMLFNTAPDFSVIVFYIYREYAIFNHFFLITICSVGCFINNEVKY